MKRISSRQGRLIKLSKRETDEAALIRKMRAIIKKDPVVIRAFKEHGVELGEVDRVSIEFADLDVSAKTKDCKIYLNRELLKKVDEVDLASYLTHEIRHLLQQMTGDTKGSQAKDYLEKDTEVAAFKDQVEFKKEHKGEDKAESYVDSLLDYHDINGKKRKDKKKELLGE